MKKHTLFISISIILISIFSCSSDFAFLNSPFFSHDSGLYTNNISLRISSDNPTVAIKYTIDGSIPSAQNGTLFENNLLLSNTTEVHAIAISEDYGNSPVIRKEYTIHPIPYTYVKAIENSGAGLLTLRYYYSNGTFQDIQHALFDDKPILFTLNRTDISNISKISSSISELFHTYHKLVINTGFGERDYYSFYGDIDTDLDIWPLRIISTSSDSAGSGQVIYTINYYSGDSETISLGFWTDTLKTNFFKFQDISNIVCAVMGAGGSSSTIHKIFLKRDETFENIYTGNNVGLSSQVYP